MDMDNSSEQPHSMLEVSPLQMYPVPGDSPAQFARLPGEGVVHAGHSIHGALILTNYRLYVELGDAQHHVPVGLLEVVEQRDLFFLHVGCKDARTYKLAFDNNEMCLEWFSRLLKAAAPPGHIEEMFAFFYFVWSKHEQRHLVDAASTCNGYVFDDEMNRLKFNLHGAWRVTSINQSYALCGSYPPQLLVPAYISDGVLEIVSKFRSSRRIPTAVWRHLGNGAVIARCSQPEVGWLGWRSAEDESLIDAIACACTQDQGARALYTDASEASSSTSEESHHVTADVAGKVEKKKVLIMDARSYTTAVANRARGGGCECPEYYPSCDIQFMNLANIHSIRKSFHALRQLCTSSADQANWFGLLEGTRWLQHMSGLMKSAVVLVTAIERDARPVLVHCSDGWDRTPQIVAMAELLLDPFYRTVDGFRILIEREWLSFGHKFADRCGHTTGSEDANERCPVFLQWLDCVHQVLNQYPCAFQFTHTFLVKLAQHTYSNLYGTFLCNTRQERERFADVTFSAWRFLQRDTFRNHLYSAPIGAQVLWPQCNVRDLRLWTEVYLGSLEAIQTNGGSSNGGGAISVTSSVTTTASSAAVVTDLGAAQHMTKTRSYGDLLRAADGAVVASGNVRRCSDPNIIVDSIKMAALTMDDIDCKSDCMYKDLPASDAAKDFDDEDEEMDALGAPSADVIDAKTEEQRRRACDLMMYSVCLDGDAKDGARQRVVDSLSVETSTETLVSENMCSTTSSSKELNGFENVPPPTPLANGCRAWMNAEERLAKAPPMTSRTPSANEWDSTFLYCNRMSPPKPAAIAVLDDDGLVPLKADVQERLGQIVDDHKQKVEALQRELQWYRTEYRNKMCRKCNQAAEAAVNDETNSVVESICSAGEGHASTVDSLRSDRSWEAVEESGGRLEADASPPTLWFPDHAVHYCMGCGNMFWLGRRKHHCRNCGRIFCSDCSENSTPLPSEQLYDPVRVCVSCYAKLNREQASGGGGGGGGGEDGVDEMVRNAIVQKLHAKRPASEAQAIPGACKTHAPPGAAGGNPRQIAASSN